MKRNSAAITDVPGAAEFLGTTEKAVRQRVARRMIPFRKWGGRLLFVTAELESFVNSLPGCTLEEARLNEEAKRE